MSIGSLNSQTTLLAVQNGAKNTAAGSLAAPAQEFESILLGQWLQSAESAFGSVTDGDDDKDTGDDQMKAFGIQQLAAFLSRCGGLGLGSMVERALGQTHVTDPPSVVAKTYRAAPDFSGAQLVSGRNAQVVGLIPDNARSTQ